MSSVKWTEDQLRAIESRGSSLLVSAAAGSGKTAVLVERLLRRIEDEKRDITEFLIITYTKAAASELRRKITDALYERISVNVGDKHLRRQLALVSNARISTVHSFCTWILRNYGTAPGLSGGFRVLDEHEGKIISDEILQELIEDKYTEGSREFAELSEYMSGARSDAPLLNAVRELSEKSKSHPYPERWLAAAADMYAMCDEDDICRTRWGEYAKKEADERLSRLVRGMTLLQEEVSDNAEAQALYGEVISDDIALLVSARKDNWDDMYASLTELEFGRLPSSRSLSDKTIPERVKSLRKQTKKGIEDIVTKYMPEASAVLLEELRAVGKYVRELCALASELSVRFSEEKRRRGVLDYSDLEHLAVELLVEQYDEEHDEVIPSETGREVSKNFCEILLDEFQDSNNVQDIIFRAVSRDENNIVMVGDVKQSIYSFRLADPSIFMKKYKSFKRYEDALPSEAKYITLSRNFRSRSEVLDAANGMFSAMMTEKLGGVDYTEREQLIPRDGIPVDESGDSVTELVLLDRDTGSGIGANECESVYIAKKIRWLVDSGYEIYDKDGVRRRVTYGDFAILLRSAATAAEHYERELSSFGIPFVSPRAEGLLAKVEVKVIVSMLSVVDNPLSDIPLLSVLRSPLFGYTADDFCRIRRAGDGALINAMRKLSREDGETAKKCGEFLSLLGELRTLAAGMPADALVWEIYNRTNALGMFGAMKNGEIRQKNLIEFYKCARDFEKSGYHGLYKFISYIVKLHERGSDVPAPAAYAADAVRIMTIHKSKGLEFPVVFLGNSIRNFNLDDIKSSVLMHPTFGIGMRYHDEARSCESSTLARDVIARARVDEMRSEELRILYVAMTRAREKLYIVCSSENAAGMITKRVEENPYSELISDALQSSFGTLAWFMLPVLNSVSGAPLYKYAGLPLPELGAPCNIKVSVLKAEAEIPEAGPSASLEIKTGTEIDAEELGRRFKSESGPRAAETSPSKVTATGLGDIKEGKEPRRRRLSRPRFMRERELNAAEKGVALHMAMQFSDFSRCGDVDGARAELLRLFEEKYLTKKQYESVDPERITRFVTSELGKRMQAAKEVVREFKFSVLLPADEVLGDEGLSDEKVLVQGVIDMYFEDEDGVTVLDFKTDAARPEGRTLRKYEEQLGIYKRALNEMTGTEPRRLVLYLVSRGEWIEV